MTETQFIDKNQKDWIALEQLLKKPVKDADQLHDLFIKVSSDLSYARTFFPNRTVRVYLNNLTQDVFDSMRVQKEKFRFSKVYNFFAHILPQEIYNSRKALIVSLIVFSVAVVIGVISTLQDNEFPRLILGDDYVDMTLDNIEKGDPMAVYKDEDKVSMTLMITTNNIRVSFLAFVFGLFGSVATLLVLLQNGIMLGAFQCFFATKDLFWTSFLTIWIHGTIEISAIIIAGGAGIVLGNGLLFPKTHDRFVSLQVSSLRALRLIIGTIPLFVIAGILESYVTRLTELPDLIRLSIILLSALLIITMWIIYPIYYRWKNMSTIDYTIHPTYQEENNIIKERYKTMTESLGDALAEFRYNFASILKHIIFYTLLIVIPAVYIIFQYRDVPTTGTEQAQVLSGTDQFQYSQGGLVFFLLYTLLISYIIVVIRMITKGKNLSIRDKLKIFKQYYLKAFLITVLFYSPLAILESPLYFLTWLILPPHLYFIMIENIFDNDENILVVIKKSYQYCFKGFSSYLLIYFLLLLLALVISMFQSSPIISYLSDFVSWHDVFDNAVLNHSYIQSILNWICISFFLVLSYHFFSNVYQSQKIKFTSSDLYKRLENFGSHLNISKR